MGIENHEIDDGLTDEERAALQDEEGGPNADDNSKGGENGEGGNGEDGQADGGEAGANGDGQAGDGNDDGASGDGAAAGDSAANGKDDQPNAETTQGAPILVAAAPEGADAKLAEIASSKKDLLTKFDDGDITTAEYQSQLDALNKQEREIEWGVEKAKLAGEIDAQRQANEWKATVDSFIRENPRYNAAENPTMYQMLDLEVRRVAGTDEFKNRSDAAAGREILAKANENLAKSLGFEAKPQAKQQQQPPAKNTELPPNLANIPAADQNDTSGGKYAVLDRLSTSDPLGYEEALMKLPEAERNAYLAS